MERVQTNTERWLLRLGIALAVSLAVHFAPLIAMRRWGNAPPLQFDYRVNAAVEIGLETAQTGSRTPPPSAPTLSSSTTQTASSTPRPTPTQPPPAGNVARTTEPPAPRAPTPAPRPLPTPRPTQLPEPRLAMPRPTPRLLDPDQSLRISRAADAGAPTTQSSQGGVPTLATTAGDLAPAVPRGSLFTLTLRNDRIRNNPNAPAVRRLFTNVHDWNDLLGGTELDPIDDLDRVVLASARPVRTADSVPDWFVIARAARRNDALLRRAIEQMAEQARDEERPRPPSPATVRSGMDGGVPDAEAPSRASTSTSTTADAGDDAGEDGIWEQRADGVRVATFNRYGARRSFVMLGDGVAAIALPGQVDALMAAMSRRRASAVSSEDPELLLLAEWDGTRNVLRYDTARGPFPVPVRLMIALREVNDAEGHATGAAVLTSRWEYDNAQQANHGREMVLYEQGVWREEIERRAGRRGGLGRFFTNMVASFAGLDLNGLEGALNALQVRVEGSTLILTADLSESQARAVLGGMALGASRQ